MAHLPESTDDDRRINLMSKNARLHMLNYDNAIIKKKLISIYKVI